MTATDDLLHHARAYAERFDAGDLAAPPARKVAVVACMDARLNVHELLGLAVGDAHVIRNAGGAVTDDAIRSLAISQNKLGTEEIVVIQHTRCGMHGLGDDAFKRELEEQAGERPAWDVEGFEDQDAYVRESLARITGSPFIPRKHSVRGFVYDVDTGALREVR